MWLLVISCLSVSFLLSDQQDVHWFWQCSFTDPAGGRGVWSGRLRQRARGICPVTEHWYTNTPTRLTSVICCTAYLTKCNINVLGQKTNKQSVYLSVVHMYSKYLVIYFSAWLFNGTGKRLKYNWYWRQPKKKNFQYTYVTLDHKTSLK